MKGFFKALGNMRFVGVLPYAPYVWEVLTALRLFAGNPAALAERLADILFAAVDQFTRGQASRVVDRTRLTEAVRHVVDVFIDIWDGENAAAPKRGPTPISRV